jgi:5,10-methylenetetrahydrofolate reductase
MTTPFRALLLNKPNVFLSLERSPFLKWSAQSHAFETGKFTHVVHPNLPSSSSSDAATDDDLSSSAASGSFVLPPRCVNVVEEEKKAFGSRAKHVQTLSASMCANAEHFRRQCEAVARGCEDVSHVLFVSGDDRKRSNDLNAVRMLEIATSMRREGDIPDHVKFAVVANPNTEKVSAEYLEQKVDAGAELVITQPFFDFERCHEWVESAKRRGILTAPSSSSLQFSSGSNASSASLVIGACAPSSRKDVEFWAKLVYGDDQFANILSSSSPIAKLAREYEEKEKEMTTALYRDWIFERCELQAVAALGNPESAGVHFMPVTRIGYDIVKHLARRTREMETMEENA